MSTELDDRLGETLHRLAAEVTAPPSPTVREKIDRRTTRLRHRRQAARTLLSAAAVVVLMAAGLAVLRQGDDSDDLVAGSEDEVTELPAGGGPLPMFTIDGRTSAAAVEYDDEVSTSPGLVGNNEWFSRQVFGERGNYAGPRAWVSYVASCQNPAPEGQYGRPCGVPVPTPPDAWSPTRVEGDARLWVFEPEGVYYSKTLPDGGSLAVYSWLLSADEVVDLADGLVRREDKAGFVATVLPRGITEQDVLPPPDHEESRRHIVGSESIYVRRGGTDAFEKLLEHWAYGADDVIPVTVLGRSGLLIHTQALDDDRRPWSVIWRHNDDAVVEVASNVETREEAEAMIAAIREIDEAEWQQLVAELDSPDVDVTVPDETSPTEDTSPTTSPTSSPATSTTEEPTLVVVPDVTGLGEAAAIQTLRDAGLVDAVAYERVVEPVRVGKVLAQNPPGGTSVARGSTVTIVVGRL